MLLYSRLLRLPRPDGNGVERRPSVCLSIRLHTCFLLCVRPSVYDACVGNLRSLCSAVATASHASSSSSSIVYSLHNASLFSSSDATDNAAISPVNSLSWVHFSRIRQALSVALFAIHSKAIY